VAEVLWDLLEQEWMVVQVAAVLKIIHQEQELEEVVILLQLLPHKVMTEHPLNRVLLFQETKDLAEVVDMEQPV
tara:strand:+ start:352 stop:573 length:222 start_codon:yes stop_codon:yes gene_type:complete